MKNSKKVIKSFGYDLKFFNDPDFSTTNHECYIFENGKKSWEFLLIGYSKRMLGRKIRNFAKNLLNPRIMTDAEERNLTTWMYWLMDKNIKKRLNVSSHYNHHR